MEFVKKAKYPLVVLILSLYAGLFYLQKINLMASDLGRHYKNGEIIIKTGAPITTNLYSYTYPDYPFVNHHWGFGVLAFLGYQLFDFSGLTVLNTILSILAVALILRHTCKQSGLIYTIVGFIVVLPLLTYRTEIRPETFSTLFIILLTLMLLSTTKFWLKISLIALLQILWVNIHIFFVFGLIITLVFLFTRIVFQNTKGAQQSLVVLTAQSLACLINPLGLKGALYPLQIFTDYGYRIVENQSPFLLFKVVPSPIYYYLLAVAVFFLAVVTLSVKGWLKSPNLLFMVILAVGFLIGSLKMVRLMSYFGIFGLVTLSYCFSYLVSKHLATLLWLFLKPMVLMLSGGLGMILILILLTTNLYNPFINFGVGLMHESKNSAKFFKETKLQGPVFNNYDAGGYLIFYLYPEAKVFVDNRPEAYPSKFFKYDYIPMQENSTVWETMLEKYQFNVIYFYRHDYTPWAQPFLIERLKDPAWAPVYVDDFALILLKRNELNQSIITKYELPKSIFLISP